jgi:hypothetical protein
MRAVNSRSATTAQILQTLVYYDGPQVLFLQSSRGMDMLAVACDRVGMDYAFFACEIGIRTLKSYIDGAIDLNYAFRSKETGKKFYFFDLAKSTDNGVMLKRSTLAEINDEEYYPESGFFARSHTDNLILSESQSSVEHAYAIDGTWAAVDFSRFYGKLADLYAILTVSISAISGSIGDKTIKTIQETIAGYAFRGGGSYVGLYDEAENRVHEFNPLSVRRISYASPGTIVLQGGMSALDEVDHLIETYRLNTKDIDDKARQIDKMLSSLGLKSVAKRDVGPEFYRSEFFRDRSDALLKAMSFASSDGLHKLCQENAVIFAKLALSIHRRVKGLQKFQAEGRVKILGSHATGPVTNHSYA